jgi:hypothetical protein
MPNMIPVFAFKCQGKQYFSFFFLRGKYEEFLAHRKVSENLFIYIEQIYIFYLPDEVLFYDNLHFLHLIFQDFGPGKVENFLRAEKLILCVRAVQKLCDNCDVKFRLLVKKL